MFIRLLGNFIIMKELLYAIFYKSVRIKCYSLKVNLKNGQLETRSHFGVFAWQLLQKNISNLPCQIRPHLPLWLLHRLLQSLCRRTSCLYKTSKFKHLSNHCFCRLKLFGCCRSRKKPFHLYLFNLVGTIDGKSCRAKTFVYSKRT